MARAPPRSFFDCCSAILFFDVCVRGGVVFLFLVVEGGCVGRLC